MQDVCKEARLIQFRPSPKTNGCAAAELWSDMRSVAARRPNAALYELKLRVGRMIWRSGRLLAAMIVANVALLPVGLRGAQALPSYARQTGQQCAACHNGFPELTPYGRLFKLNGYTFTGGQSDQPPLAMMVIPSYTHTQAGQTGGAAPGFGPNNNFALDAVSLFYAGKIASNVGAFAQATDDGIGKRLSWDNTDIRYANTTTLMDDELVFGLSLNNNPGVTDVWNSTPAWGYPYQSSGLAPTPAAGTLIEGGLAAEVVGTNVYGYWNRLIYAEAGGSTRRSRRAPRRRWASIRRAAVRSRV